MAYYTLADFEDAPAVDQDRQAEPKYRCMHPTHPDDERRTFSKKKELNRHMKVHNPDATLWSCGCCQNLGDNFEPKVRKDKVQTHLRKIHERPRSEDNKGISCPEKGCYTLCTAASCLDEHLRQNHSSPPREIPSRTANGE